ncbi:MAG TPA: hypothetical protein VFQ61_08390 [Polyangiaceae bacterium]|nr:hypothetical protein [Polyangiaceae bacterium]
MAKSSVATHSTRWSLIVRAQGAGDTRVALGELICHYEKFIVWLIQHHRHPPDTSAEELKQEFLEGVLRRNDIAKLDRQRGSFRGWLGLAVRRFLFNEWNKWKAASAGRMGTIPMGLEVVDGQIAPDDASDREFARHVVLRALALHRDEQRDKARFDTLARFLPGPQMDLTELAPVAEMLGLTPTALAKSICVLRARFRGLLREAVADLIDLDSRSMPNVDEHPLAPAPEVTPQLAQSKLIDEELRDLRRHFWK